MNYFPKLIGNGLPIDAATSFGKRDHEKGREVTLDALTLRWGVVDTWTQQADASVARILL
jgi:hypothetical protein